MRVTRRNNVTHPMIVHRHIFTLAIAVVVGIPTLAMDKNPTGRHISGIVQKTNGKSREVEFLRTDSGGPLGFVWNNRTKVVANIQFVSAAILQQGAKVEVIHPRPFFGRPFVTKVTLLTQTQ